MSNLKFLFVLSLFLFTILNAKGPGLGPTFNYSNSEDIPDNLYYDKTITKTYTKKQCYRAYTRLKKDLKKEAKRYCKNNGWALKIYNKTFSKISCKKVKKKGRKTKITVTGHFRGMCIN
jgi:GTP-sensing pleiotropic transcriptional regulator CodY